MITLTINNRTVEVDDGTTLLDAARQAGVHIPTLCYYPRLPGHGVCRICLVDVVGEKNLNLPVSPKQNRAMLLKPILPSCRRFAKPTSNGCWRATPTTVFVAKSTATANCRALCMNISSKTSGKKSPVAPLNIHSIS